MQVTLRRALKRRRMTLTELAEKSGVNKSTIYRIESGEVRPLHETVTAMEAALGLKPGSLVFERAVTA